jgi:hypothetical protein
MGWRFFQSLKLGLVRLNLSRAGLGISAGFGGLRFGLSGLKRPYVSFRFGPLSYFSRIRSSSGYKESRRSGDQVGGKSTIMAPDAGSPASPTQNQEILQKIRDSSE